MNLDSVCAVAGDRDGTVKGRKGSLRRIVHSHAGKCVPSDGPGTQAKGGVAGDAHADSAVVVDVRGVPPEEAAVSNDDTDDPVVVDVDVCGGDGPISDIQTPFRVVLNDVAIEAGAGLDDSDSIPGPTNYVSCVLNGVVLESAHAKVEATDADVTSGDCEAL